MKRELLVGCGNSRDKRVRHGDTSEKWHNLTTLDIDPGCKPDVVWDLEKTPFPFEDNTFDEIHAYETLEHQGKQGDWKFFFSQFHEFWRILKPDGFMVITVPQWDSPWAFGDPGHTRVLPFESFMFLDQDLYAREVGVTAVTDYRPWWKGNLKIETYNQGEHTLGIILKAIK